ncbi:WD40/YVTN/BNR-like repeat-containing protein [Emticicia sp. SJ17W-69]|uniref:WD40/YVTN/BNR-like repeat-containing protein n=1 Tax=Emticicia sp. SJ17W-69 TaxID=3421657 RepID=UPI003EB8FE28
MKKTQNFIKGVIVFVLLNTVFSIEAQQKIDLIKNEPGKIRGQKEADDDPEGRKNAELERVSLPDGKVPYNEMMKAQVLVDGILKTYSAITGIEWKERGPNNIGGRTRALMFDPNDATHKKVWAGGVAGGIWYNTDITNAATSWIKVNDFWDNLAISCIAYDPSNPQVFYVGTGEGYGNSDATAGGGIWKTTNGGATWKRLLSTMPDFNVTTGLGYAFQNIQKIVVTSTGVVYAGTQGGLAKSSDGGNTWTLITSGGLPTVITSSFVSDIAIGTDGILFVAYGRFYDSVGLTGTKSQVYRSTTSAGTTWTNITPAGIPANSSRTSIALAASTSGATQKIYVLSHNYSNNGVGYFKSSIDAGTTWTTTITPPNNGLTPDYTNGQAWYDLPISVHPTNPNIVIVGGATHARSIDGGVTWYTFEYCYLNDSQPLICAPAATCIHPDHHAFLFRPGSLNEVVMANDGGVFYSSNYGDNTVVLPAGLVFGERNKDYNVTQYYNAAIANTANDGYVYAGAQDNGTHIIRTSPNVIGCGAIANGGDGVAALVDQNDPNTVIMSYVYANHYLFDREGNYKKTLVGLNNGTFINPCDFDSPANVFWTYGGQASGSGFIRTYLYRVDGITGGVSNASTRPYFDVATPANLAPNLRFIKVAKAANTLFVGTGNGEVYKLVYTSPSLVLTATKIMTGLTGFISCIDIGATDNELIVTSSTFSVKSVYYTNNGGTTWTSKDESTYGLPNIPVRYALFNPLNYKQVLISTDMGVWSTNDITAVNPGWALTNSGLAHVRCESMRYRSADNTVILATHGRGTFTTKLSATPLCQNTYTLISPYDNKTTGTSVYQASQTISATNKIQTGANVTYKAGKYIELKPTNPNDGGPGFLADTGSVFYAYITGCVASIVAPPDAPEETKK